VAEHATALTTPRGRPRSRQADHAIHDAVLALLEEQGYAELSIEGVAERAGVAKTTIYRRYSSKPTLVAHALLDESAATLAVPDTGSLRRDLVLLLRGMAELLSRPYWARTVPAIAAAAVDDPELDELLHRDNIERFRAADAVYVRARARGELPPGIAHRDIEELLSGALNMRALLLREPVDDTFIERIVDLVLRGAGARTA
jgi:AcrR family transcriptional regulator